METSPVVIYDLTVAGILVSLGYQPTTCLHPQKGIGLRFNGDVEKDLNFILNNEPIWAKSVLESVKCIRSLSTMLVKLDIIGIKEAHGDVIPSVQKLKGVPLKDAARYLGISTGSHLSVMLQAQKQEGRKLEFQKRAIAMHGRDCKLFRAINKALACIPTPEDLDRLGSLYHERSRIEAVLSVLEGPDNEEKYLLVKGGFK